MPKMNLSHFEVSFTFAPFTSIVPGIVTQKTGRERMVYGAQFFGYFLLALFGLGWAMRLGHR